MDVFEAVKTRRSIRKYKDAPVEWDKVAQILEAGRLSPSAGNVQEWRFIVVTDDGLRKKLAEASLKQWWMAEAPVHIVVISQVDQIKRLYGLRGERLYSIQNCAVAATQMMLTAHSIGLGTCWVGAFEEGMVQRALGIPDNIRVQAILTIGYADEDPDMPSRFPMEHVVLLNGYGGNVKKIADVGKVLWDHNIVGKTIDTTKQAADDLEFGKFFKDLKQKLENLFKK